MKKIMMTRLSVCSLGVACNEMIDTPMLLVVVVLCRFLNPNCLLYKISLSSRKSTTESATLVFQIF